VLERYTHRLVPLVPTIVRIAVGIVFLFSGLPKLQNPPGFIGFVTNLGFPLAVVIGWLPVVFEPIGGLLLILGIGTRWLGAYFILEMLITTFVVKALRGTPLIVAGGQPGTGYELDLVLLAGAFVLFVLGSGPLSIERNVLKREL
jgi:putative oxidoreductase